MGQGASTGPRGARTDVQSGGKSAVLFEKHHFALLPWCDWARTLPVRSGAEDDDPVVGLTGKLTTTLSPRRLGRGTPSLSYEDPPGVAAGHAPYGRGAGSVPDP